MEKTFTFSTTDGLLQNSYFVPLHGNEEDDAPYVVYEGVTFITVPKDAQVPLCQLRTVRDRGDDLELNDG